MIIRKMMIDEYDKIDSLMQQLHQLHFTNRPDLFVDLEHPYSKEEYEKLLGAVRMDLMVWSFNESAKNLYESLGMKPQRYIYEKNLR